MSVRKKPRLPTHDYSQPGWYFVTVCTKGKRCILGSVVGADVLIGPKIELSDFGRAVECVILSMTGAEKYVIMPNHVHLLLRIAPQPEGPMGTSAPTGGLPQIIRYFKREVTRICGECIWQRSYYDHIVRDEADWRRIWSYIDTNPARWADDCYYGENTNDK